MSAPPKDEERLSVVDAFKVSPTNPASFARPPGQKIWLDEV